MLLMETTLRTLVAVLAVLGLSVAACASDDDGQPSTTSTESEPPGDDAALRIGFNKEENPEDDEPGGLFSVSMSGGDVVHLVTDPMAAALAWSPDRSRIAFHSAAAGDTDIYIANADGTDARQLTGGPHREAWPAWSPDGTRLLFERIFGPDRRDLFVINADGTDEVRLTDRQGHDESASWSPDGTQIVFVSDRDDNPGDCDDDQSVPECNLEIYAIGSDGTDPRRITTNESVEGFPRFSPDGNEIIFHSNRDDGDWEVYLMALDGSDQANLTNRQGVDGHACFTPDGTKIVLSSQRAGAAQPAIYTMSPDGTSVQLIPGTQSGSYPAC